MIATAYYSCCPPCLVLDSQESTIDKFPTNFLSNDKSDKNTYATFLFLLLFLLLVNPNEHQCVMHESAFWIDEQGDESWTSTLYVYYTHVNAWCMYKNMYVYKNMYMYMYKYLYTYIYIYMWNLHAHDKHSYNIIIHVALTKLYYSIYLVRFRFTKSRESNGRPRICNGI